MPHDKRRLADRALKARGDICHGLIDLFRLSGIAWLALMTVLVLSLKMASEGQYNMEAKLLSIFERAISSIPKWLLILWNQDNMHEYMSMLLDCSTVLQNQSVQPELRLCYWLHASLTSITKTMMIKHIHYIESTLIWETAGDLFIDKCVHETKNVFSSIFFLQDPMWLIKASHRHCYRLEPAFPWFTDSPPKKNRSLVLSSWTLQHIWMKIA